MVFLREKLSNNNIFHKNRESNVNYFPDFCCLIIKVKQPAIFNYKWFLLGVTQYKVRLK